VACVAADYPRHTQTAPLTAIKILKSREITEMAFNRFGHPNGFRCNVTMKSRCLEVNISTWLPSSRLVIRRTRALPGAGQEALANLGKALIRISRLLTAVNRF
jgi:hypothetical protein